MNTRQLYAPLMGFALLALGACSPTKEHVAERDLLVYVDPFIGTGGHGHTFPGATRPNAMVQFSPDTHLQGWEASSGYHESDSLIYAFSLTHLSGTGIGDLGDVALLPYSGVDSLKPVARFSKANEVASPGYYSVYLENFGIQTELTSTERVGLMRLKYELQDANRNLLLDLGHILQPNWGHKVLKNDLEIVNDSTIRGTYYTKGWADQHQMSYTIHLSTPADSMVLHRNGEGSRVAYPLALTDTTDLKLHLYLPQGTEPLLVKTGLSHVSPEQAEKNLAAELPHWDFDRIREESREIWRGVLGKIQIESQDQSVLKNFYTAMYHAHIAPFNYQDVDGHFRGMDKQVHRNARPEDGHYTVFSLWDTYRTLHPLLTIIDPDRALRYGRSLISDYQEGTILPRWPLAANYTGCMPAYHSVSVLADLVAKGLASGEDLKLWAEAGVRSSVYRADLAEKFAGTRELDLITRHPHFKETLGFIPADSLPESVSWAVEMAYDDWCIARIAEAAGLDSLAREYDKRGRYYQRYWDKRTNLMRPVMADGSFRTPFNPRYSAHMESDYTEGNAYQWSFYAPHDMQGFIKTMGGREVLEANLDTLFTTSSRIDGEKQSGDITGLIGQYAHGNEPSHHIAYLYNYTASPHKGQALLDSIMYTFYKPTPDGIIGNEDCGQMSAWYVMSALGFYPVCPGLPEYQIGRPIVDEARIAVQGGVFTIKVKNNSRANKYVASVKLDGKPLGGLTLQHSTLRAGGTLEIEMTDKI
ncbi:GH92 family glycosyl hydrolase [Porphyromonas sp. COT-290 OH860]|uniref:GH92 family glycosyl hydrolase n=1 Tax=Porphyromonas sp. COT-290 OH860 TaxID=1515615 RepID=UPI00052B9E61|nr:GH92 family glycosyl hydrolase [Porphyromonas sp. COT-290 OH860]KGN85541.1 glycoside hydrolase [Porphyromonas sp. COT-290 OH860]